jgi:hypothetical protein
MAWIFLPDSRPADRIQQHRTQECRGSDRIGDIDLDSDGASTTYLYFSLNERYVFMKQHTKAKSISLIRRSWFRLMFFVDAKRSFVFTVS